MIRFLVLLIATLVVSSPFDARGEHVYRLFKYTTLESECIHNVQPIEAALSAAKARPSTMEIYLVRLDTALLSMLHSMNLLENERRVLDRNELAVAMRLPSGQLVEYDTLTIRRTSPSKLVLWGSRSEDVTTYFVISVFDDRAIGNLGVGHEDFLLSFLGDELHALIQIDTSVLKQGGQPEAR